MINSQNVLSLLNRFLYIVSAAMLAAGMVLTIVQQPTSAAPSSCPAGYMLTVPDAGDSTAPFCIPQKVTVCHRNNGGVGYVSVDVSINSVTSNEDWWENGHGQHTIAGGEVGFPEDAWPDFYARNGDFIGAYGNQALVANGCTVPSAATATPTNTAVPPTSTPTNPPTSTATPVIEVTNTPTSESTTTSTPVVEETNTPTPEFTSTSTPGTDETPDVTATPGDPTGGEDPTAIPTLSVPSSASAAAVADAALLIPVTGLEVSTEMHKLTYGGLGLLGLGMVLSGIRRRINR